MSSQILTVRSLTNVVARSRIWIYVFLAVVICLVILIKPALPANEILENTRDSMRESQEWWDDLWRETFDPSTISGNISYYSFINPVRFIIGVGLIFWIADYGQKMANSQGMAQSVQIFSESFLPIVLILIFLANQGVYSRALAYALRDIVNSWSDGLLEQQIVGKTINSALQEQLLVEEVKNEIRRQANSCMQMPRPEVILPSANRPAPDPDNPLTIQQQQLYEYFECWNKLLDFIEQKEQEATGTEACQTGCEFFKKVMKELITAFKVGLEGDLRHSIEKSQGGWDENIDPALENTYRTTKDAIQNLEKNSWMFVFSVTQWLYISFLEMALWLNGLFAPLFVALSLIPGKQKMFYFWLIEHLTIGIAKLAYVAIIGVVAVQISTSSTVILTQDQRFFMALGAFGPGVSLAVATVGGIGAAMSFRNQSVGAASVASSVLTGSIVSVAYSFSRYADKRR